MPLEAVDEPMIVSRLVSFIFRFVVGSTTGALFVPIAMYRSVVRGDKV